MTVLVVAGALFGPPALEDMLTGSEPAGMDLEVGPLYVLTAPLGNLWDVLTILTLGQHWAVLATLLLVFAIWRITRPGHAIGRARRFAAEAGAAAAALAALLLFYGYGVLGPRPMAALAVDDPDVVVVDFHSHTSASHDGRPGFGAEARREWHAGGGFDAAYISDHRTYAGWMAAVPGNAARAGEGTALLPALEIRYRDVYVNALGEPARYERARDGNELDPAVVAQLAERSGRPPTFVLSVHDVRRLDPGITASAAGVVALEMSEASPRGLRRSRQDRELLIRMTDSLRLAPVAATGNHGWGRAVAACWPSPSVRRASASMVSRVVLAGSCSRPWRATRSASGKSPRRRW